MAHRTRSNSVRVCALSCSVMSDSLRPHGLQPARLLCPGGFSRQEYWSGLPCPPPVDLPTLEIEPRAATLQMDSLSSEPPGKPNSGYSPFRGRNLNFYKTARHPSFLQHWILSAGWWEARQNQADLRSFSGPSDGFSLYWVGKGETGKAASRAAPCL